MLVVDPIGFETGLQKDQFEKYPWPISDDQYKKEFGGVIELFLSQISSVDSASADVLAADNRYVLMLLSLIHANAATNLGKEKWGSVYPEISIEELQKAQQKDIHLGSFKLRGWSGLKNFGQAIYRSGKHSRIFHHSGFGKEIKAWFRSFSFFTTGIQ